MVFCGAISLRALSILIDSTPSSADSEDNSSMSGSDSRGEVTCPGVRAASSSSMVRKAALEAVGLVVLSTGCSCCEAGGSVEIPSPGDST